MSSIAVGDHVAWLALSDASLAGTDPNGDACGYVAPIRAGETHANWKVDAIVATGGAPAYLVSTTAQLFGAAPVKFSTLVSTPCLRFAAKSDL